MILKNTTRNPQTHRGLVSRYITNELKRVHKAKVGKRIGHWNLSRGMVSHHLHPDYYYKLTQLVNCVSWSRPWLLDFPVFLCVSTLTSDCVAWVWCSSHGSFLASSTTPCWFPTPSFHQAHHHAVYQPWFSSHSPPNHCCNHNRLSSFEQHLHR